MNRSTLTALERWYAEQCDGDWEHSYGVKLETLDNPGWQVVVDLAGTGIGGRALDRIETHRSDTDWLVCWVEDGRFHAAGGPMNLEEALRAFLDWAASA